MTRRRHPDDVDPADLLLVAGGALALALFEGPVSLRKLRADLAGMPSDVSLAKLLAGRLVWTAALVPLLLVLWRVGSRELARRRGLPARTALTAEALPFAPFAVLVSGFLPGWGDTASERWSFAMLFLFLGAVATSTSLRIATWQVAFAPSARRRGFNVAIFIASGAVLWLATRLARPFDVQPHWSTLADQSPYWPTRAYVALWTAWVVWLTLPVLVLPAEVARSGRSRAARILAIALGALAVALGLTAASLHRAGWDDRAVAVRFVPGRDASAVLAGRVFTGRVVGVPGRSSWRWRPAPRSRGMPVVVELTVRIAALPEAGLWYRAATPTTVEVRATAGPATNLVRTWTLAPRRVADDRDIHTLRQQVLVLPAEDLVVTVNALSPPDGGAALPILADVTISAPG